MKPHALGLAAVLAAAAATSGAQQVADTSYRPVVHAPAYAARTGPLVLFDEAHRSFHRVDGRYRAFATLLERDGHVVRPNRQPFSRAVLDSARILVIANAVAPENEQDWFLPTHSAFATEEIQAVRDWVRDGGSLLLIADHMPFAGAAAKLAAEFGVLFGDGFAVDSMEDTGPMRFRRSDGSLGSHPVIDGRTTRERIDSLTSAIGSSPAGSSDRSGSKLRLDRADNLLR